MKGPAFLYRHCRAEAAERQCNGAATKRLAEISSPKAPICMLNDDNLPKG
jgi:hypothetical protein